MKVTKNLLQNRTEAQIACQPILDAKDGNGVFGQCQSLGNDDNGTLLDSVYNDCVFDVCQGYDRCNIFTAFVHTCQAAVPGERERNNFGTAPNSCYE